jgi:hypothetical protein
MKLQQKKETKRLNLYENNLFELKAMKKRCIGGDFRPK